MFESVVLSATHQLTIRNIGAIDSSWSWQKVSKTPLDSRCTRWIVNSLIMSQPTALSVIITSFAIREERNRELSYSLPVNQVKVTWVALPNDSILNWDRPLYNMPVTFGGGAGSRLDLPIQCELRLEESTLLPPTVPCSFNSTWVVAGYPWALCNVSTPLGGLFGTKIGPHILSGVVFTKTSSCLVLLWSASRDRSSLRSKDQISHCKELIFVLSIVCTL